MYFLFIIGFIIVIIFSLLLYSQKRVYQRENNEMNILQIYDPEPENLFNLYNNNLPIIIQSELQNWDGFNELIGINYDMIKSVINENLEDILTIIKGNLQFHNNIFSYNWNIDVKKITFNYDSPIFMIQQNNLLQLFSTITGEARIILMNPEHHSKLGNFKNNVSDKDITEEINKPDTKLDFIEIILREGNMIYIPYGWHYFMYGNNLINNDTNNNDINDETIILDCINLSLINHLKF